MKQKDLKTLLQFIFAIIIAIFIIYVAISIAILNAIQ